MEQAKVGYNVKPKSNRKAPYFQNNTIKVTQVTAKRLDL